MAPSQVRRDTEQWQVITEWLESRLEQPLTRRDWLRPAEPEAPKRRLRPALVVPAAAAAVGALAIAMWFLAATRQDTVDVSPEPVSPQVAFDSTPVEPIERRVAADSLQQPQEEAPARQPSAGEVLQERWQLTGVVSANGANVVMLSDREERRTVRLSDSSDLDGWAIKESGPNYAVLVQGEDEVRLVLNEDIAL